MFQSLAKYWGHNPQLLNEFFYHRGIYCRETFENGRDFPFNLRLSLPVHSYIWYLTWYQCKNLYRFSERLGCSVTSGHCPGLSLDYTARTARTRTHERNSWQHCQKTNLATQPATTLATQPTITLATQPETTLATQPENDPHQTWRVGSTRWAGGHLHRESAIDGAPPQIGFPPHQILSLDHPTSQNSGLEAQNKLKATSRQNWRQMAPLPNWLPLTL